MTQLAFADRAQEFAMNVGTGTVSLLGASNHSLRTFAAAGLNGQTVPYVILHRTSGQWEVGYGVYTATGATLMRAAILSNSLGTTAPVAFLSGVVDVWNDLPAEKMVALDADSSALTLPSNLTVGSRVNTQFLSTTLINVFPMPLDVNATPPWAISLGGAGTDYTLSRWNPATGGQNVLTIARATGNATFAGTVTAAGLAGPLPWTNVTARPTTLAGYGITDAITQAAATAQFAPIAGPFPWAGVTGRPTTLAGYGITDAITQAQATAQFAPIAGPFPWAGVTGTPTTLAGYGITNAVPVGGTIPATLVTAGTFPGAAYTFAGPITAGGAITFGPITTYPGGVIGTSPSYGLVLQGANGGTDDFALFAPTPGYIMHVPHGTANCVFVGGVMANSITSANGLTVTAGATSVQALTATTLTATTYAGITAAMVAAGTFPGAYTVAGNLTVAGANGLTIAPSPAAAATLNLISGSASFPNQIGASTTSARWVIWLTDGSAESGSNAGSSFLIQARSDTGAVIDNPITIVRAAGGPITFTRPLATLTVTGAATFNGAVTAASASGIAITPTTPGQATLALHSGGVGACAVQAFSTGLRWELLLGNGATESGNNAGNDVVLRARDDSGAIIDVPFSISRALTGSGIGFSRSITVAPVPAAGVALTLRPGASGLAATIQVQTTAPSTVRWIWFLSDGTAETGSDAGSNFALQARTDAGGVIDNAITITRAAHGAIAFTANRPLTAGPITSNPTGIGGPGFTMAGINGTTGNVLFSNNPSSTISQVMTFRGSLGDTIFGASGTATPWLGFPTSIPGSAFISVSGAGRAVEFGTNGVLRVQITDAQTNVSTPIVIGTDPGGTQILRIGGSVVAGTPTVFLQADAQQFSYATGTATLLSPGSFGFNIAAMNLTNFVGRMQSNDTTVPTNLGILSLRYGGATPNNTANIFLQCNDTSGTKAALYSNGGLANYQSNNVNLSDERLKEMGDDLDGAAWYDRFGALRVRRFRYRDDRVWNIGLGAQQVEAVAPELVDTRVWSGVPTKMVYTTDLYHAHIAVTQEAQRRIAVLEAEVHALRAALLQ